MPINIPFAKDDLTKFAADLQKYFDREVKKIKKGDKSFSQESASFFIDALDRINSIIHEIDKAQEAATIEVQREIENNPRMQNLSQEQIREIIAVKKREKIEKAKILRSLFVIACASDKEMGECLKFAQKFDIKDLSSFDETINSAVEISPLVAAMLRRRKNISAMKELERAGADIHAVSMRGNNIAHMISYFGANKKLIDHLIENKVNFNVVNKMGLTALDVAVGRRDVLFIKYLKEKADAKFKFTPLDKQKQIEEEEERVLALTKARVRELITAHAAAKIRRAKMPDQNVSAVETFSSNTMLETLQNYSSAKNIQDNVAKKDDKEKVDKVADVKSEAPPLVVVEEAGPSQTSLTKEEVKHEKKETKKADQLPKSHHENEAHQTDQQSLFDDVIEAFAENKEDDLGLFDLLEALAEEASDVIDEIEDEVIWFFDDEEGNKKANQNQVDEVSFVANVADQDLKTHEMQDSSFVQKVTEEKLRNAENSQQGGQAASAA